MNRQNKKEYIKALYSEIIKVLYKYVIETLEDYNYEGSPIKNEYIDRETLNQIIDRVIEKAGELEEIDEIALKENLKGSFNEKILLRGIIELLIINELFVTNNEYNFFEEELERELEEKIELEDGAMTFYINLFDSRECERLSSVIKGTPTYFGDFL